MYPDCTAHASLSDCIGGCVEWEGVCLLDWARGIASIVLLTSTNFGVYVR